jgi:hypothetical protein
MLTKRKGGTDANGVKIRLWRPRLKAPGSPAEAGSCKVDRPIAPHLKMGAKRSRLKPAEYCRRRAISLILVDTFANEATCDEKVRLWTEPVTLARNHSAPTIENTSPDLRIRALSAIRDQHAFPPNRRGKRRASPCFSRPYEEGEASGDTMEGHLEGVCR